MMKRVAAVLAVMALVLVLPVPVEAKKDAKDYSKTISDFKKIPEVAKGLGEGIRNFKTALKGEEKSPAAEEKKQA